MPKLFAQVITPAGQLIPVPGGVWDVAARTNVLFDAISQAVGAPVLPAPAGVPNAGNLKAVHGRPDVLVRVSGGTDDREHRASLHVTREHHTALMAHLADGGHAFQACVVAVERLVAPGAAVDQPVLALAVVPYEVLAPVLARAFAARPALQRINVTLAARREDGGLALRIPEFGLDVDWGVESVARVLRRGPGIDRSALLTTPERVAVVAAVLGGERGLATTACPLDARTRVAHGLLHAVGLPTLAPHRLGIAGLAPCARPSAETLGRSDLIGAPITAELLASPRQPLVVVELEHTTRDGVEKLGRRYAAAERLGLCVGTGLLVVRDEDVAWFRDRLAEAPATVRARTEIEPFSAWYRAYVRLRDQVLLRQRDQVRRSAA